MHGNRDVIEMVVNFALFIIAMLVLAILTGCGATRNMEDAGGDTTPSLYIPPLAEDRLSAQRNG